MKDLLPFVQVVVKKTAKVVTSRFCFAEDSMEFFQSPCCSCHMRSTLIFLHSTNQNVNLWRRRCWCRRRFQSFLIRIINEGNRKGSLFPFPHFISCCFVTSFHQHSMRVRDRTTVMITSATYGFHDGLRDSIGVVISFPGPRTVVCARY